MITRGDAELLVQSWAVAHGEDHGGEWTANLEEFDIGFVGWVAPPAGVRLAVGAAPAQMIDRVTGEATPYGNLAPDAIAAAYRRSRDGLPVAAMTIDPVANIRAIAARPSTPTVVSFLMLRHDRRLRTARGAKGDMTLNHHPLVRDWFATVAPGDLVRGAQRHSDAILISDVLHSYDALMGRPTELAEARAMTWPIEYATKQMLPGLPAKDMVVCHTCGQLWEHLAIRAAVPELLEPRWFLGVVDRPDLPQSVRDLAGGSVRSYETRPDGSLIGVDDSHQLPPEIEDLRRRFQRSLFQGSMSGQVHRVQDFSLNVKPEQLNDPIAAAFGRRLGLRVSRIGTDNRSGSAVLVMDEHGRVYSIDQAGEWFVGPDIYEAVLTLSYGRAQPRLRDDGTWEY